MTTVGQIEKKTQARLVALLRDRLHYDYLGNWIDRADNRNIEPALLRKWLVKRGIAESLIGRSLHELQKVAGDTSKSLYDRNADVYRLLRYGVKLKPEMGENAVTVWLMDWADWTANHFAFAEEVTVSGATAKASGKRPDIVLYVNGIALGVLELKRSTVSVSEGIRQNLDNQKKEFIEPFFSTMQWVMAEVRLASGDYVDLKAFEPAMRYLIDTYIRAQESEKLSAFDDLSLIQLIVERGAAAVDSLPGGIRKSETAVAETIENNVRRLIINESPVDPAYYEKMSKLLDALIEERRKGVLGYKEYLGRSRR